jgi:exopolyphosphatase/pppGpp-phosphohydrolase
MTLEEKRNLVGLQKERAEVIAGGVAIVCEILKIANAQKIIISEKITNFGYFVTNCLALEHIIFEGVIIVSIGFKQSSLLDNASIQSIINCLADLTGQTAQTLTLHADVGAKLTDEQKVTITAKNWILAY